MSAYAILDADGHVTESQEQVSKYLDDRHKRRPQTFSFYPWDGWDRRLLGTLGDSAGNAETWLRALDKGGMELTVLYPTLGLFMSFLRDREWAVALCKAYNSMLHEEFIKVSPRLKAVALLPVQEPAAAAVELRRAVKELGLSGGMLAADGTHLLGDPAFDPVYAEAERLGVPLGVHASGLASRRGRRGHVPALHPGAYLLARLRPDAPAHLHDPRGRARALPQAQARLPRGGLRLGALLDGAHGRRVRQARRPRPPRSRRSPAPTAGAAISSSPARRTSGCCPRPSSSWARTRSSTPPTSPTGTTPTPAPSTRSACAATSPRRRSRRCSATTAAASTASSHPGSTPMAQDLRSYLDAVKTRKRDDVPGRHPGGRPGLRDHRDRGEAGARGEAAARASLREGEGHALPRPHQSPREPLAAGRRHALRARRDAADLPRGHGQAGAAARGRQGARQGRHPQGGPDRPPRSAPDRPPRGRRRRVPHRRHLLREGSVERDVELRLQPPHDQGARHHVDPSHARQAPLGVLQASPRRGASRSRWPSPSACTRPSPLAPSPSAPSTRTSGPSWAPSSASRSSW